MAQRLLSARRDVFPTCAPAAFGEAFEEHFVIAVNGQRGLITGSDRTLYRMIRRRPAT